MITTHSNNRIQNRLKDLISNDDIRHIENVAMKINARKHYIRIRQFSSVLHRGNSHVDCITAIIEGNSIVTVMLSHNTQRWNDGTFKVLLSR